MMWVCIQFYVEQKVIPTRVHPAVILGERLRDSLKKSDF